MKNLYSQSQCQLCLHLNGNAGPGRSRLLTLISMILNRMAEEAGIMNSPLRWATVTAVGAMNYDICTLHFLFHIPIPTPNNYMALNAIHQQSLRLEFRGVIFLIINESSLLGPQLLRWIDLRCREIFPFFAEKPFGGLNIILG